MVVFDIKWQFTPNGNDIILRYYANGHEQILHTQQHTWSDESMWKRLLIAMSTLENR